ncbi:response regulator [Rhodospirillaceae bacterium SYSU D60014]|uniref:response regulator n=1 Tax=Virgifigura deserti TaxID=2268457 RepID=UPI000E65FC2B
MVTTTVRPIDILLVEDNPGDVRLTKEALKESRILNNLYFARDGVEALAFLTQQEPYQEVPRPDLILLDLNLPRKDGRELLAEIKQHQELKRIPVVILTTSEAEQDILKTYELHANCYITKPVDLDKFVDIVKGLEEFWLSIVKLPSMVTAKARPTTDK